MITKRHRAPWGRIVRGVLLAAAGVTVAPLLVVLVETTARLAESPTSLRAEHATRTMAFLGAFAEEPARKPAPDGRGGAEQSARSGLVEKVGVSLTLLDVEVTDERGLPLRGLEKKDFRVWLDNREWSVYSVDDLCSCEEAPVKASGVSPRGSAETSPGAATGMAPASSSAQTRNGASGTQPRPSLEPSADAAGTDLHFVFFFDFGHLAVDGRARAFKEARRWVQEVKRPADLVGIFAHTPRRGLAEICPFTSDIDALLAGLGRAEKDAGLQDTWPSFHKNRWDICKLAGGVPPPDRSLVLAEEPETQCRSFLEEETLRGERSLKGLQDLIESLGGIAGRKALILFNQAGALETGAIYPNVQFPGTLGTLRDRAGQNLRLADQVAAEAILSRTTIHAAYVGDRLSATRDAPWEVDLSEGALAMDNVLAEATGGTHNLDLSDLQTMMSAVRARCSCLYRLGLEPRPDDRHGRVYQARVEVRGRVLQPRFRVTFLTDLDRSIRRARNILRNPSAARDLPVGAALIPVRASKGTWDLAAQLALDVASIEFVPAPGGTSGPGGSDASWEAGALLVREDDQKNWELLGLSGAHRSGEGQPAPGGEAVLHEHLFTGIGPGRYHLAAFVKDRSSSLYGGAEATVELPAPGRDGLTEPVLVLASRRHMTAPLPFFEKTRRGESRAGLSRSGAIPLLRATVHRGERLAALTWLCGSAASKGQSTTSMDQALEGTPALTRYISRDGVPIFRLADPRIDPAGDCQRVTDLLETSELEAGSYTYTIEFRGSAGAKPLARSRSFTVVSAPRGDPAGPAGASSGAPSSP